MCLVDAERPWDMALAEFRLLTGLSQRVPDVRINEAPRGCQMPGTINARFPGSYAAGQSLHPGLIEKLKGAKA